MDSEMPHDVLGTYDILRQGLANFKSDALPLHPLQTLQQERLKFHTETKRNLQAGLYGSAFVLRNDIDRQILSRVQRPPGLLPSSMLGLDSLTGTLDELKFEELIDPRDSGAIALVDMHHGMEVRLGISKSPASRAFF